MSAVAALVPGAPAPAAAAAMVGTVVLKPSPSEFHCWMLAGLGTICAALSAAHSAGSAVKKWELGPGVTEP
ncbi:MAG: hypothetical protein IPI73_20400 [Betaproteobacteria bacterium]|nr:hypothetical protein [Betaproteobacteria bacterium]